MAADPAAFRRKYRAMAADPFAFYRGTACLFYADLRDREDRWADERTGRVWIQGDLHAENFGTYMDGEGVLVFDVNDYDEAYLGHFTWDLQRLAASLAVHGLGKALPDDDIRRLVETCVRAYLDQVHVFVDSDRDHEWSLRLDTARGRGARGAAPRRSWPPGIALLDEVTVVEDYDRRFRRTPRPIRLLDAESARSWRRRSALPRHRSPSNKRLGSITYELKGRGRQKRVRHRQRGPAGVQPARRGHTQALENDVVLTMKQGGVPGGRAASSDDAQAREYFEHEGHRTGRLAARAAGHADPWLGWAGMDGRARTTGWGSS
jgi:hypothetical protein